MITITVIVNKVIIKNKNYKGETENEKICMSDLWICS